MSTQASLFEDDRPKIQRIGNATVTERVSKSILNPATGFISAFDYTLNPYSGCQFGCEYCYASAFVAQKEKVENWGGWVEVKSNAVDLLSRFKLKPEAKIYVGSVTDPYQPIEAKLGLTRRLLELLSEHGSQPSLVIQTRSPLVCRDIDLLQRFKKLRVSMSITTDSETIRKQFEPNCPSIDRRMQALRELKAAGIKTAACITPMLPLEDPLQFGQRLAELKADIYVTQPFHKADGRFAARTNATALAMVSEHNWTKENYQQAVDKLRESLPNFCESRNGFIPE